MGCKKLTYSDFDTTLKVVYGDFFESKKLDLNYYPFGMTMVGRSGSANSTVYNRGFQGQIKTDEISGEGNHYTAQFWEYDPRLGRRWNQDPVVKPWMSPYHAFSDNPIAKTDPNGDTDDWIKDEKTGEYKWDSKVTSESTTPEDSRYIGPNDDDIVKDLFGKNLYTSKTEDYGGYKAESEEGKYAATYWARIFTTFSVRIDPIIENQYNSSTNENTKIFKGVKFVASSSGYTYAPLQKDQDMDFATLKMTINGKELKPMPASNSTSKVTGGIKEGGSGPYTYTWSDKRIYSEFNTFSIKTFNLEGNYTFGGTALFHPGVFMGSINYTETSLNIKYINK